MNVKLSVGVGLLSAAVMLLGLPAVGGASESKAIHSNTNQTPVLQPDETSQEPDAAGSSFRPASSTGTYFSGSPGTKQPLRSLGPARVKAAPADTRDEFSTVTTAPLATAAPRLPVQVTFTSPVTHYTVGSGWKTWSADYKGSVYSSGATTMRMKLPKAVTAFAFYAEPDPFAVHTITARSADGTSSGPVLVFGDSGAMYFGFVSTDGDPLRWIEVASDVNFAVGRFTSFVPGERRMVTMGDSYSSGEGNPPFDADSGRCHRSAEAWPRWLATKDETVMMRAHIACSGATRRSLTRTFKGEPPQLQQLVDKGGRPEIVTITLGGNDVGFAPLLTDCFIRDCVFTGEVAFREGLIEQDLYGWMVKSYEQVQALSPGARVVVVGYPRLFPELHSETTRCGWLSSRERTRLNQLGAKLNKELRLAAKLVGVEFVSVGQVLDGHELCTSQPWVYPISATKGGQLRAHPLDAGQRAIGRVVMRKLALPPR